MTEPRRSIMISTTEITTSIDAAIPEITSQIKHIYSHIKSRPIWLPTGSIEKETQDFYQRLEIPLFNNRPSLLLHGIDTDHSSYSSELFGGPQKQ
jgi:hypothetical protein